MPQEPRGVIWEAYEHHHDKKPSEWFLILGIMTLSLTIASVLLGNTLFGIVIIVGGALVALVATREPKIISYAVTQRGLRIDDSLYPYTALECFCIDEESNFGPQLLVKSEKMFMPLLILPLPEDAQHEIEQIVAERLPEQHLEEPFAHKVLEFFRF